MIRNSRFARAGWLLAAMLQLLLPAFASVADARAERESRGARSHIEAHGNAACPRIHPEDCVVCRVLAAGAVPSAVTSVPVPVARSIEARPEQLAVSWCAARAAGDPPQRAPPA